VQKSKRTGLPDNFGMKHDDHFVDLISSRSSGTRIRMISTLKIYPNPHQPRSELGNLKELMLSIKEKGIIEPVIVRPKRGRYEIIAGERRFVAAKRLGLEEIPCIEKIVEDNEAMELSLVENLQRKNLNSFEEADALKSLREIYGYNHEKIANKIGKARSTITEIISISKIPDKIRLLCEKYNIKSRTTLIEIAKQKSNKEMNILIDEIKNRNLKREDTRELSRNLKRKEKRSKYYVYKYMGKGSQYYKLRIEFKNKKLTKNEIIEILKEVINKIKNEENK